MTLAFCLAQDASAAEATRYSPGPTLAQADAASTRTASSEIKNIQRLLKLLADRYPAKYASIDPGTIDGSAGAETQVAIRNFQRISGTSTETRNNDQLVANILATLAQMSATQPAETVPEKNVPGNDTSAMAKRPPETAPKTDAARPPGAAGENESEASAAQPEQAPGNAVRAAPAPPEPTARTPNENRNVFFVQSASLKSLDSAKREWRRILEQNRAALTGEQVYFERAEIAGRGTFFRILIGPMNEKDAAKTLCSFLKQNGQACVVTARNRVNQAKKATQGGHRSSPMPSASPVQKKPLSKNNADPGDATTGAGTVPGAAGLPDTPSEPAPGASSDATETGADRDRTPGASSAHPAADAPEPTNGGNPTHNPATTPPADNAGQSGATPADSGSDSATPKSPGGARGTTDHAGNSDTTNASAPPSLEKEPAKPETILEHTGHAAEVDVALLPTEPQMQPGNSPSNAQPSAPPPIDVNEPTPRPSAFALAAADFVDQVRELGKVIGISAALLIGAGLVFYGWRRRKRRPTVAQIVQPANFSFSQEPSDTAGPLGDIESDFESESLRQSRAARDDFLRGILGSDSDDQTAAQPEDSAIRINSSLKTLLVQEPAQYKSIFMNWIFLAKVGAAIDKKEITREQLSDRIDREFDLLQAYFTIHLLELDDRHSIRQELPGLFYCLQLSRMKTRQRSAAFSAA